MTYVMYPGATYHSTAIIHVMCISVLMSTEVHCSSHSRERSACPEPYPTVACFRLKPHLQQQIVIDSDINP